METMSPNPTKTDLEMQDRMMAFAADPARVEVIAKARAFKQSWIELADALAGVFDHCDWQRWGFESFDLYCKNELHITPATARKLLGSFRFLESKAPRLVERARELPSAPIPSMRAVDFVQRAQARGAADPDTMRQIEQAAFEDGDDTPALNRKFKQVAFPITSDDQRKRLRTQLVASARKLASLIAEPDAELPHEVAVALEEALGRLLESISN